MALGERAEGLLVRCPRLRTTGLHGRRGARAATSGSATPATASATPSPTSSDGTHPESLSRSMSNAEITAAIADQTPTTASPKAIPARTPITLAILPQGHSAGPVPAFRAVGFPGSN